MENTALLKIVDNSVLITGQCDFKHIGKYCLWNYLAFRVRVTLIFGRDEPVVLSFVVVFVSAMFENRPSCLFLLLQECSMRMITVL